ncbi:hypothetical protein IE077_003783 [Cardiosporidium cionae]|uniref:Uncharacterized protein n=1 Tax=Cardiosporidium cionae TaxID=476202 RepID=A0ABQ7J7H9_9APIC|nr:hypothetical protein IE077_003783 [Cardiosporidium cionae]|eukprot:KAF8819934.1 hypothetical protein IE077_003783 [Cardiosporidium cionae]
MFLGKFLGENFEAGEHLDTLSKRSKSDRIASKCPISAEVVGDRDVVCISIGHQNILAERNELNTSKPEDSRLTEELENQSFTKNFVDSTTLSADSINMQHVYSPSRVDKPTPTQPNIIFFVVTFFGRQTKAETIFGEKRWMSTNFDEASLDQKLLLGVTAFCSKRSALSSRRIAEYIQAYCSLLEGKPIKIVDCSDVKGLGSSRRTTVLRRIHLACDTIHTKMKLLSSRTIPILAGQMDEAIIVVIRPYCTWVLQQAPQELVPAMWPRHLSNDCYAELENASKLAQIENKNILRAAVVLSWRTLSGELSETLSAKSMLLNWSGILKDWHAYHTMGNSVLLECYIECLRTALSAFEPPPQIAADSIILNVDYGKALGKEFYGEQFYMNTEATLQEAQIPQRCKYYKHNSPSAALHPSEPIEYPDAWAQLHLKMNQELGCIVTTGNRIECVGKLHAFTNNASEMRSQQDNKNIIKKNIGTVTTKDKFQISYEYNKKKEKTSKLDNFTATKKISMATSCRKDTDERDPHGKNIEQITERKICSAMLSFEKNELQRHEKLVHTNAIPLILNTKDTQDANFQHDTKKQKLHESNDTLKPCQVGIECKTAKYSMIYQDSPNFPRGLKLKKKADTPLHSSCASLQHIKRSTAFASHVDVKPVEISSKAVTGAKTTQVEHRAKSPEFSFSQRRKHSRIPYHRKSSLATPNSSISQWKRSPHFEQIVPKHSSVEWSLNRGNTAPASTSRRLPRFERTQGGIRFEQSRQRWVGDLTINGSRIQKCFHIKHFNLIGGLEEARRWRYETLVEHGEKIDIEKEKHLIEDIKEKIISLQPRYRPHDMLLSLRQPVKGFEHLYTKFNINALLPPELVQRVKERKPKA